MALQQQEFTAASSATTMEMNICDHLLYSFQSFSFRDGKAQISKSLWLITEGRVLLTITIQRETFIRSYKIMEQCTKSLFIIILCKKPYKVQAATTLLLLLLLLLLLILLDFLK